VLPEAEALMNRLVAVSPDVLDVDIDLATSTSLPGILNSFVKGRWHL
jgi:hypothetical protein